MRFYLAVLDALTAGERIAQAAHAVTEMALAHPEAFRAWHAGTNTVVVVEMDGRRLATLLWTAQAAGDAPVAFHEPDRGDERTAVAVFPHAATTRRLLRRAPLAGANAVRSAGFEPARVPCGTDCV